MRTQAGGERRGEEEEEAAVEEEEEEVWSVHEVWERDEGESTK